MCSRCRSAIPSTGRLGLARFVAACGIAAFGATFVSTPPAATALASPEDDDGDDESDDERDTPRVRFWLPQIEIPPGADFDAPLFIESDAPISMVSFSVEYEGKGIRFVEPVLSTAVVELLASHPASESSFVWHTHEEREAEDEAEGEGEEEEESEGWLQVSLVLDFDGREAYSLPANQPVEVVALRFRVDDNVEEGEYKLEFSMEGAEDYEGFFELDGAPIFNAVKAQGSAISSQDPFRGAIRPDLAPGGIRVARIIGDIGFFSIGDVNRDVRIDIADPIALLGFLFLGKLVPPCFAAADTNADGALDLSDVVLLLLFLFEERSAWQPTEVVPQPSLREHQGCSP